MGNTDFDFNKEPMATDKQIKLLEDLGVEVPDDLTLQDAKTMISEELAVRSARNYEWDEDDTYFDHMED